MLETDLYALNSIEPNVIFFSVQPKIEQPIGDFTYAGGECKSTDVVTSDCKPSIKKMG